MNTQHTLEQMKALKLKGMADSYKAQLGLPVNHQLEGHELIAHLLEAEKLQRGNERMESLLKNARLRFNAPPETIVCSSERNLSKSTWNTLLEGRYLEDGTSILITGATGTGKSWLACSLGYQACIMGIKTRYFSMHRLIESVLMAKTEGTYVKLLNQIEKIPLIILDDFGLQNLNKQTKPALLQIMEDRYAKKSIIITAQLPVSAWHEYLSEPAIGDALCDRLTAKSHRIELAGPSMRRAKQ
jgi:DNA replication protein DnaC